NTEFSSEKFWLVYPHPSDFCVWRYTCFSSPRSYYVYRILFVSLFTLLLILDYFWIIGFGGAGLSDRLSACLDGSQWALVFLSMAYGLFAYSVAIWVPIQLEANAELLIPYKFAWFIYTCSTNAVYVCMVIFWVSGGFASTFEQQLKHSIPGCMILLDLCFTGVPLFFCHAIYVILVYFTYLAVVTVGMLLSYTFGLSDKTSVGPSNPTVWIGGFPLFPNGYSDFSNVYRIVTTIFSTVALAVMVHCILLTVVITRDFFASLFHRSTGLWIRDDLLSDGTGVMYRSQTTSTDASTSRTMPGLEKSPSYGDNAGYDDTSDVKQ
ncbi:hypothetical protein EG68_02739, partial [Paragonimus skrjabini miyazakii]